MLISLLINYEEYSYICIFKVCFPYTDLIFLYGFKANIRHGQQKSTAIYENTHIGGRLRTTNEETAGENTLEAKGYDIRDEEFPDEINDIPKSDTHINKETISDISIRDLDLVIRDKRHNEYDGFKQEYAVSEEIICNCNTK